MSTLTIMCNRCSYQLPNTELNIKYCDVYVCVLVFFFTNLETKSKKVFFSVKTFPLKFLANFFFTVYSFDLLLFWIRSFQIMSSFLFCTTYI